MTIDRTERETRPSPDALLKQTAHETRGRLKIFLGAAPGVGKTYEMLLQARQRQAEGVDVVIGIVETHGRAETEMLTAGFETVVRKRVPYKSNVFEEMDLDAILKRRPALVLVDELAHTNAPGGRHPKRYLDVEELLAAGVDVYSTLNVQHLESLNDVVARITHVQVRETVPDSMLDRADDVELVDLTPEDLIQRLKEGKVYVPEQAERAIRHYFMPGNLTALRELALRRTAQRVDAQMVDYMRAHAIEGPWEASERVLVCVSERSGAAALVRYTRRLADRLRASWAAISIETTRSVRLSEAARDRIAEALRLAERLGGQAVTVPAESVARGVIEYAQANNFTQIIVSASKRSWLSERLRASAAHEIIRRAGGISVHVIPEPASENWTRVEERGAPSAPALHSIAVGAYIASLAMVAGAFILAFALHQFVAVADIALFFLLPVLASAVTYGLRPALWTCLLGVLAYNFFFLPPLYHLTISNPENVVALIFFAIVAVIASNLTARVRAQAVIARARAKMTDDLYQFSRKLAGVVLLDDLLWATAYQVADMLKVRVVLLLPEGDSIAVRAGYPPEDALDDADIAAAKWAWQHGQPAGRGADTLPGAKRLFVPMRTGLGTVGIIGLDSDRPGPLFSPEQRRLFDSLADQAALAIERINLVEAADRSKLAAETERLRNAMLTSVSHDLRTPLAAILGSATTLKNYRSSLDDVARDELTSTIQEEAERLNRFIANLLDMTRLESGALNPNIELVDLSDVIGSAVRRAQDILAGHNVVLDLPPKLPMLDLDPVLFEQALFNLLDNAAKYSPPGTCITIRAAVAGDRVRLGVIDEGEGIPEFDTERIFDKFYRVHAGDQRRAGTGLGLAICRGFVEAMGGTIAASNRKDRSGAIFTISLPEPAAQRSAKEAVA